MAFGEHLSEIGWYEFQKRSDEFRFKEARYLMKKESALSTVCLSPRVAVDILEFWGWEPRNY